MDSTNGQIAYTDGVTVVTPSLPHRNEMLVNNMESVRNQTLQPKAHLIGIDYERIGGAKMINKLIGQVRTKWFAPLADDDVFYPQHLERLVTVGEALEADMIYPWCHVVNRGGWNPNAHFDEQRLRTGNYIPATVLMKTEVWNELGGYPDEVCEDWAMWIKMLDAGKKIRCLPEITWEYRFHGRNISDGKIPPWEV